MEAQQDKMRKEMNPRSSNPLHKSTGKLQQQTNINNQKQSLLSRSSSGRGSLWQSGILQPLACVPQNLRTGLTPVVEEKEE